MNELTNKTPDDLRSTMKAMSDAELDAALAQHLGWTAQGFLVLAHIVAEKERRGHIIDAYRCGGILHHLRKIACGQLLPEIVVLFGHNSTLITRIGNLPLTDQRRIADGEPIPLALPTPQGDKTHRMIDTHTLASAKPEVVNQVFARDHIRTIAEQAVHLDQKREEARKPIPERIGKGVIDVERGGVKVGRYFIPHSDIREWDRALRKATSRA